MDVKKLGVVGAGQMGQGIAQIGDCCFATNRTELFGMRRVSHHGPDRNVMPTQRGDGGPSDFSSSAQHNKHVVSLHPDQWDVSNAGWVRSGRPDMDGGRQKRTIGIRVTVRRRNVGPPVTAACG